MSARRLTFSILRFCTQVPVYWGAVAQWQRASPEHGEEVGGLSPSGSILKATCCSNLLLECACDKRHAERKPFLLSLRWVFLLLRARLFCCLQTSRRRAQVEGEPGKEAGLLARKRPANSAQGLKHGSYNSSKHVTCTCKDMILVGRGSGRTWAYLPSSWL